jgi:hypothetical protein
LRGRRRAGDLPGAAVEVQVNHAAGVH